MKTKIKTLLFMLAASVGVLFAETPTNESRVKWQLDDQGILIIKKNSVMQDYVDNNALGNKDKAPWSYFCNKIKEIVIEEGVTNIGQNAFSECKNLTSVIIPKSVKTIGNRAFYNCGSLESVSIPNSVIEIGEEAFYKCTSLSSATMPSGLEEISNGLFRECAELKSMKIPATVTKIGDYAFAGCSNLSDVVIPQKISRIGQSAFKECYNIVAVTIPDEVSMIEKEAFANCLFLEKVTIGKNVRQINRSAFNQCPRLVDIYVNTTSVPQVEGNPFGKDYKKMYLWIPANRMRNFQHDKYWSNFVVQSVGEESTTPSKAKSQTSPVVAKSTKTTEKVTTSEPKQTSTQEVKATPTTAAKQKAKSSAKSKNKAVAENETTTSVNTDVKPNVAPAEKAVAPVAPSLTAYVVTAPSKLNVRAATNTQSTIIGTLQTGDLIYVEKIENGSWAKIQLNGKAGYVSTKYIKDVASLAAQEVAKNNTPPSTATTAAPVSTPAKAPAATPAKAPDTTEKTTTNTTATTSTATPATTSVQVSSPTTTTSVSVTRTTSSASTTPPARTENSYAPIVDNGDGTYTLNGTVMTSWQMRHWLEENCVAAHNEIVSCDRTADKCAKAALSLSVLCAPFLGVGIACFTTIDDPVTGGVMFGVIGALVTASIPCWVVGAVKTRNAVSNGVEVYNAQCARRYYTQKKSPVLFQLTASKNGMGCAINF